MICSVQVFVKEITGHDGCVIGQIVGREGWAKWPPSVTPTRSVQSMGAPAPFFPQPKLPTTFWLSALIVKPVGDLLVLGLSLGAQGSRPMDG